MTSPVDDLGGLNGDELLAGEYVMGVLTAEERRNVEARLLTDQAFAETARRWEADLSAFNDDYRPMNPSTDVLQAVEERLFGAERKPNLFARVWDSTALWRALAVVFIAINLGFALSGLGLTLPKVTDSGALVADLRGKDIPSMNLLVRYDDDRGALHVTPVAAEGEKSLELWLVQEGQAPTSLGVLPQTGDGEIIVPVNMRERISEGMTFAVSLEPYGGSPTGIATGPVLASGVARLD